MTLTALLAATLVATAPVGPTTVLQQAAAPAPQTAPAGLTVEAMTAYLTAQGLTVGAVEQDGERRFAPVTDGDLRWVAFFQSCEGEVCSDLQFSFGFSNAGVTLDGVNRWNRERRFLKAFFEPATPPSTAPAAAVQYDVILNGVQGVEQLADPLAIWRGSIPQFPGTVAGAPPAP